MLDPIDLTGLAQLAADALVESAITDHDRSTWVGATFESSAGHSDEHLVVVHRTGDATLYQGSAGIALACLEAAEVLDRADLADLAASAARGALSAAKDIPGTGLYDGLSGIGLSCLKVGDRLGDRQLRREGLSLLEVSAKQTHGADLISGAAGVLLSLVAAAGITNDERWLTLASTVAESLVDGARRHPWGWSWSPFNGSGCGLCGLAHGAAGIAWALAEFRAAHGAKHLGPAIAGAIQYERSWFDYKRSSWPDLRVGLVPEGAQAPRPTVWCHGAGGIGLTRLRLCQLDPHPGLIAEAAAAMQACFTAVATVVNEPDEYSFGLTLCHGAGGVIELLLAAHDALGEEEHLIAARWLLCQLVQHLGPDPDRWPSGIPHGGTWSAGLMVGLAGTMLLLIRSADPGRVPSVGLLGIDLAKGPPLSTWTETTLRVRE